MEGKTLCSKIDTCQNTVVHKRLFLEHRWRNTADELLGGMWKLTSVRLAHCWILGSWAKISTTSVDAIQINILLVSMVVREHWWYVRSGLTGVKSACSLRKLSTNWLELGGGLRGWLEYWWRDCARFKPRELATEERGCMQAAYWLLSRGVEFCGGGMYSDMMRTVLNGRWN